jgi:hypothetical protein
MSPVGLYGSLVVICAASIIVGWAVLAAIGRREWSWLAPGIGLAVLVALGGLSVTLPGRATTAAVVVAVAIVISLAVLWRVRPSPAAAVRVGLPIVLVTVLAASLPFAASGGFDVMGSNINDDLGWHLYNAEWLRTHEGIEPQQIREGYPIGPHGLVLAVSGLTGIGLPEIFTALLIAAAVTTALASLAVLGRLRPSLRTMCALLVGFSYLGASFYVQSTFKETLMGLFVLGFALALRDAVGENRDADRASNPIKAAIPPALFAAASLQTYSVNGLAWALGTFGLWAMVTLGVRWWRGELGLGMGGGRWAAPTVAAGVALLLLGGLGRGLSFLSGRTGLGESGLVNLVTPITPFESLGVWLSSDFRFAPPGGQFFFAGAQRNDIFVGMFAAFVVLALGYAVIRLWKRDAVPIVLALAEVLVIILVAKSWRTLYTGLLFGLGLVALALGAVRLARRRELVLGAAVVASAIVYVVVNATTSEYLASKALAVMAPLIMLIALVGLVPERRVPYTVGRGALLALFASAALFSSYLALAGARVDRDNQEAQLAEFRPEVQGKRVLFLANDEFAPWYLRGASTVGATGTTAFGLRVALNASAQIPHTAERSDFDSVGRQTLDDVDYVITPSSSYASEPPRNFHDVASTESFTLWKRTGPTPPRRTLPEGDLPGGVLDCKTARDRKISRSGGEAHVFSPPPVVEPFGERQFSHGVQYSGPIRIRDGHPGNVELRLPRGRWELALQYWSLEPLLLDAPRLHEELPRVSQVIGQFWPAGTLTTRHAGTVPITVAVKRRPLPRRVLGGPNVFRTGQYSQLGNIAAIRAGAGRESVPLSQACGQLVDWYQPASK